jgi:hypothetical protein
MRLKTIFTIDIIESITTMEWLFVSEKVWLTVMQIHLALFDVKYL